MNHILHRHTVMLVSTLAAFLLAVGGPVTHATPSNVAERDPFEALDAAMREVLELEERIAETRAEQTAIGTRLDVLDERIVAQLVELERAREELRLARDIYGNRVVFIYKTGGANPLFMLLEARSFRDFVTRSTLVTRIAAADRELWEHTARCAAEENYQTSVLENLRGQESELRDINESRKRVLQRNLARQQELVEQLSEEAAAYLAEVRAREAKTRQDWVDSSIPIGVPIERVPAIVEPYLDRTFLVSAYQPIRYRVSGDRFIVMCSWYGNEFNGRTTASGQIFNEEDFTCASRTLPFGTRLALTRGDRRIVVVVNDRGPFVSERDLDLSKAAARELGFSGVEPVLAEYVVVIEDGSLATRMMSLPSGDMDESEYLVFSEPGPTVQEVEFD